MPEGCIIRDANNNIILDSNQVNGAIRIFGSVNTGSGDGSVTDARYQEVVDGKARVVYFLTINDSTGRLWERPFISYSGHTLSWTWQYSERPPWTITYGVW